MENRPKCFYPPLSSLLSTSRLIRYIMQVGNNTLPFETRKVQDTMRCIMISIPKRFANKLKIAKGDLVKIQLKQQDQQLQNQKQQQEDNSLIIISKVRLD